MNSRLWAAAGFLEDEVVAQNARVIEDQGDGMSGDGERDVMYLRHGRRLDL
ncbi:MAG: hypothetical protein HYV00_11870 [Deltaproteobacteria bacterium]|nr:hypothetical protein [Deltaproteobacteria bacterium]